MRRGRVALPDRYGALSRARERSILLWFLARALTLCDVSANVTQGNKLRSLMVLSVLVAAALAQNLPLPPLPYDYTSLEPHIDEATMRVHHMSHHQTYTDKLNGALAKLRADPEQKWLAKLGVDALISAPQKGWC